MYSPYLYARASELLALRNLLKNDVDLSALLPILEPVVANVSSLLRCMDEFGKAERPLIIVVNPLQNEFHDNVGAQQQFRADLDGVFARYPSLIPGYLVGPHSTKAKIENFCDKYAGRALALLYSSTPLDDAEFKSVISNARVAYHAVLNERIAAAQVAMLPKEKLIDVRDEFNKLPRNADYDGAEFFTDRHKNIGKSFAVIGDYTITGRVLEVGGGKPGAIAIHATYKNQKTADVWVEHFVSDDRDRDIGDAASKFLQAARKLVGQAKKRPREFGSDAALDMYAEHVENGTFSGLPKNKEYQLYHHICLMLSVVTGKL